MASLDQILREQRRKAEGASPYAPRQTPMGQQAPTGPARSQASQAMTQTGRVSGGKAAGLYHTPPRPQDLNKNKQVLNLSEAVTEVAMPDGSFAPAQAPSGAPYVVRAPGSRSTFLDPVTGNRLAPDVTSPTGLQDITAQKEEEQAQRKQERSRIETAKLYEKAIGEVAKEKEEEQKRIYRDQENQYRLQGRRYFNDRNTGEPVALETDAEFAALQSQKAKDEAIKTQSKVLSHKLKELDLEGKELQLDQAPLKDKEREELQTFVNDIGGVMRERGFNTDDEGISKFGASTPEDAELATQYRQKRDAIRADEDLKLKLKTIERRKLDLEKQLLNPGQWKLEKDTQIQNSTDADLDREVKENEEVMADLEERVKAEADPINARDQELTAAYQAAQQKLGQVRTGAERIRAQRDVNEAAQRLNAWMAESQQARDSVNETNKALNERIDLINQANKTRTERALQERKAVVDELKASPFLAPYGARLEALDNEEATRQKALADQYPDGIPPEAEQAMAQDLTAKRQQLAQEIGYAQQTKQANLRGLYEKYGSQTRSEDWRTENDPQLEGLWFNLMNDAKKVGLTEQEVREGLETSAALDWSNPRRVDKMGRPDFFEDFRMLPNGAVTVNPRHYLDEVEYAKAVAKSPASDKEKEDAIAMRRDIAAEPAAKAYAALLKNSDMAAWLEANTKGTPLDRMEQFEAELKKGGALAASFQRFQGGTGGMVSSLFGAVAGAMDSPWAMEQAQWWKDRANAFEMAGEAAGKGTGPLGRFISKVAGAAPSVAPGIAVGMLTSGAGLPTSAALFANALTAAAQSGGSTYLEAYDAQPAYLSHTEKRARALTPSIASGIATGLITSLGGARGVESLLAAPQEALKQGIKASLGRVLTNLGEEALEEGADQLVQGILAKATYNPGKSIQEIVNESTEAFLIGGVLGGGTSATKELSTRKSPVETAQPVPVDEGPLPEEQAVIQTAIQSFEPTPELLPASVAAVAETSNPVTAAQNAAQALVAVSQGAQLDDLTAAQLEAVGYEKTDKGAQPKKGVQPLIYSQDGQLVIRDEAIQWLNAEDQPVIRDQIGLTEQERIAQIQQPTEPQANETTQPAEQPAGTFQPTGPAAEPSPEVVTAGVEGDLQPALTPGEQAQDLADQEALMAAQEAERAAVQGTQVENVATLPRSAPPSRRKAIGKGTGKQSSFAEFPADTDAQAFAYSGNAKKLVTGRNLSESERAKLLVSNQKTLKDLATATGLTEQELRGILPQYTKAITAQAKTTPEGQAFQAEPLADFIARTQPAKAPKPASTPAKPRNTPAKPSQEAAEALGIDNKGKFVKNGFVAASNLKGDGAKRLQVAAKAIVETIDKAASIKGVKLRITNNPEDPPAFYELDGTIVFNPRALAEKLAQKSADVKKAPREFVIHELIHRIAAARLSMADYSALWRSLTPEMQQASLREYYRGVVPEGEPLPDVPAAIAGAEFFAQLVEARLKGKLASQVWDSPTITERVRAMVDQFIKALRDLANATTDPTWKRILEQQADAVEQDLRTALREAGLEQEFLGEEGRLNAPPSNQPGALQGQYESLNGISEQELRKQAKPSETVLFSSGATRYAAEDKTIAMAYASNPGFGGNGIIYGAPVQLGRTLTNPDWQKLVEDAGLDWEETSSRWDRGNYIALDEPKVRQMLKRQGYDAVRYKDDFPDGAEVTFLVDPPEWQETNINPFKDRGEVLDEWGYGVSGTSIKESSVEDLLTNEGSPYNPQARRILMDLDNEQLGQIFQQPNVAEASQVARLAVSLSEYQGFPDSIEEIQGMLGDTIVGAFAKVTDIWRNEGDSEADIQTNLEDLAKDAAVELPSRLNAPPSELPSPIPPEVPLETPTEAADAALMEQSLEDLKALDDLRNDPEAMKALADQIKSQPEGQKTPDPRNRALMGVTEETRALQQAALVAQTQNGLEAQQQADVFRRAKEAVLKDRAAVEQNLFDKIEAGEIFNTDDLAQAQQITELLQREATVNPQDKALYRKLLTLTNAWADNKTATGRALSIMRDPRQGPLERMRQSIAVVSVPPTKVRNQIRAAWAPREKSARIRALEDQLAAANNAAQVKLLKAELDKAKAIKDKQEIIDAYAEENRRLQDTILKTMNLTQDDVMLNPEDRYGMQEAVLDNPDVRAKVAELPRAHQSAIRLAMLGYSDKAIATRAGVQESKVPAIVENFRQNILKPAMTQAVKGGDGFGAFLRRGLDKIRGTLRAPFVGTLSQAEQAGKLTAKEASDIEAEVDRIINFALQPARFRNKAGSMQAKVVTLPNGSKVRMFLPFDPDDARGFYRYARELSTRDSSAFDKIYEYWINGILSGPQTQVANLAGNMGQIGWNYTFQRMAESALNLAYRDPESATLGEYPHVVRAFFKAVGPAWQSAKLAYDTEADNTRSEYLNEPLTVSFTQSNLDKMGGQQAAIKGKSGRVVRIPGRLLRFTDAFFKTAILNAEATAHAYREGKGLGYSGATLDAYMTQRLQDRGSSVWQNAMGVADELLFQSDNWATKAAENLIRGKGWKASVEKQMAAAEAAKDFKQVESLRKQLVVANFVSGIMRFIFPFVRTPTNILRVGVRKAGGAAISTLFNTANGLYQRAANGKPFLESYPKAKQIQDLSESALAGAAWFLLSSLAEGDEDDDKKPILIVGNRPYGAGSKGEKEEVMRKYGGTQVIIFRNPLTGQETGRFAYGRYEPFATALGVIVDTMRELKQARNKPLDSKKAFELTGSVGAHLMAQAESKSFLQGLASVARTMEEVREGRFNPGPAAGKALVSGIIPNLIRQTMRNTDDYQRDYKSADMLHEAFPTGDFASPATGPNGEPVKKGGSAATRLLFQVPNAPSRATAESAFQQYNLRHPENRIDRAPLTKAQYFAYEADGKTKKLLENREDQRMFREIYERTYAKLARSFVATNPLIRTQNPPLQVVEKAGDLNSSALRETRERFLQQKKVREALERAKNPTRN